MSVRELLDVRCLSLYEGEAGTAVEGARNRPALAGWVASEGAIKGLNGLVWIVARSRNGRDRCCHAAGPTRAAAWEYALRQAHAGFGPSH